MPDLVPRPPDTTAETQHARRPARPEATPGAPGPPPGGPTGGRLCRRPRLAVARLMLILLSVSGSAAALAFLLDGRAGTAARVLAGDVLLIAAVLIVA